MTWLFDSGHAVDIVLAVLVVEFAWLITRRRWNSLDALLRLTPGAMMLLALRASLTGSNWRVVALLLLLSFPLHLADLRRSARHTGTDR